MKKRKPPVVLASVLIVLVGLAVVLFPKENPNQPPEAPAETAERAVPTGESRKTPTKEEIAGKLKIAETAKPMAVEDGPPGATAGNPATATIYVPKSNPVPQTPNESSTAQQWYRPDSRANTKQGFKTN